ncbi:hypothetical protein NL108_004956, partial [Boleophthalmus pectinirostris]
MRCADITADKDTDGHWAMAKGVFNSTLTGTVLMRQQIFSDGSSMDTTLEVTLHSATGSNVSLHISTNRIGGYGCTKNGGVYNPFNMATSSSTCSMENPLSCVCGEISMRQDPLSLTQRQVYTDRMVLLTGDFTGKRVLSFHSRFYSSYLCELNGLNCLVLVVHRSLVVKNGDIIIACADILPESPSAEQSFPTVIQFSRYDFRRRVADVLQLEISQVTILAGSPEPAANGRCQRVHFMVAGDVNPTLLKSVKTSEKMGLFKESAVCLSKCRFFLCFNILCLVFKIINVFLLTLG